MRLTREDAIGFARQRLDNVRGNSSFWGHDYEVMEDLICKHELSCKDIGSSEEEMESFRQKVQRLSINSCVADIQSMIREKRYFDKHIILMLNELTELGGALENTGLTQAEIDSFCKEQKRALRARRVRKTRAKIAEARYRANKERLEEMGFCSLPDKRQVAVMARLFAGLAYYPDKSGFRGDIFWYAIREGLDYMPSLEKDRIMQTLIDNLP